MILEFLEQLEINIVLSFYMNGILSNFRVKDNKAILSSGSAPRPMGMSFTEEGGWALTQSGVTYYKSFLLDGLNMLRPIVTHYVGNLDCHELVVVNSIPVLNATRFNALVTIDADPASDFKFIYKPSFCDEENDAKDTHHVNGIGLKDGGIRYVTAFSDIETSELKGWKHFPDTGVVWDVVQDEPALRGLTLPHSPRLDDGFIYVCNSGTGELLRYMDGKVESLYIGNFIRGMEFYGRYIFIGGSMIREDSPHLRPNVLETNRCALYVVDKVEFKLLGYVDFNEHFHNGFDLKEIFDLSILKKDTLVASTMSEGYKLSHFFDQGASVKAI